MGGKHSSDSDSDNEGNNQISFQNKDISYIYTTIQILYNLKDFKKYIVEQEVPEDSDKKLAVLLRRIFLKEEKNINLEKYSKKIYKLINNKYDLELGDTPGKILIQIIELLNFEENGNKINIWEETVIQNQNLFMNTMNQLQALNDFKNIYQKENNTKINEFFHGILLKRIKIQNFQIMHIFSNYCVYELNIPYIYQNLASKGKNIKNPETKKEEISLFDCISYMKIAKKDVFNNEPCIIENHMYTTARYLFFLLKRESENNNNTFYGDITYPEKYTDFSNLIIDKNKNNNFKLVSIIKEIKFMAKNKKKKQNDDDDDKYEWYEEDDDNNNSNKNEEITNKYITIIKDENDNFYCYNKDNIKVKINLDKKDDESMEHILVYEKCVN